MGTDEATVAAECAACCTTVCVTFVSNISEEYSPVRLIHEMRHCLRRKWNFLYPLETISPPLESVSLPLKISRRGELTLILQQSGNWFSSCEWWRSKMKDMWWCLKGRSRIGGNVVAFRLSILNRLAWLGKKTATRENIIENTWVIGKVTCVPNL